MMEIIKDVVDNKFARLEEENIKTKKPFNLYQMSNELLVNIILNCAFGIDIGN
jgi:hypothetical protein